MQVSLVVIYNHSFPDNYEKINYYYGKRFSNIYHAIPFSLSTKKNIIPIFEVSYMFIGHIANVWKHIYKDESDYVVFIGDDLLLNPKVNEENIEKWFQVVKNRAYIHEVFSLGEVKSFWRRSVEALSWTPNKKSVQLPGYFPHHVSLQNSLKALSLCTDRLPRSSVMRRLTWQKDEKLLRNFSRLFWTVSWNLRMSRKSARTLNYPLVGGYSDLVIIPKSYLKRFSELCGVYNVLGLHTELAIPTILAYLFGKDISTAENTRRITRIAWNGEEAFYGNDYDFNISRLKKDFPTEVLYAHPVKMSKWVI